MAETFTITKTLVQHDCPMCFSVFAVTDGANERFWDGRLKQLWCPYCGRSMVPITTTVQKLNEQLANEKRRRATAEEDARRQRQDAEHFKRSRNAVRGVLTKTRKAVGSGECPVCGKTLQGLAKHMAALHPDYKEDLPEDGGATDGETRDA